MKHAKVMPSLEYLQSMLTYNPDTGEFHWNTTRNHLAQQGDRAGFVSERGYRSITIAGTSYQEHRLAWYFHTGTDPGENDIDHKNHQVDDNRIANLRPGTAYDNQGNRIAAQDGKASKLPLGVYRHGNAFQASIDAEARRYHLGTFDTPELAYAAYVAAKTELHQFQTLSEEALDRISGRDRIRKYELPKGVHPYKSGKFKAETNDANGKTLYIGLYDTIEQAADVAADARAMIAAGASCDDVIAKHRPARTNPYRKGITARGNSFIVQKPGYRKMFPTLEAAETALDAWLASHP